MNKKLNYLYQKEVQIMRKLMIPQQPCSRTSIPVIRDPVGQESNGSHFPCKFGFESDQLELPLHFARALMIP